MNRFCIWIFLCFWGAWGFGQVRSMPKLKVLSEEFMFEEAPFAQCHASTLVELGNGSVMAAWFGGTYERHPDVSIYTSSRNADGWSFPEMVADGVMNDTLRYPCWNPVLFRNSTGQVMLFYKVGPSPSSWWGMYKTADSNGKSWSGPEKLPHPILGPIKNKPIQVDGHLIVSPSSTESEDGVVWKSHVELSTDGGYTWTKAEIPSQESVKIIQPTLLQVANGDIKAFLRSDQDVVMESISHNQGLTWSMATKTTIPNPNSGIDAVSLKEGGYLLVYNPMPSGKDWSNGREKLNLAFSPDGNSWTDVKKLEDQTNGEYSYPVIIQDSKGIVHISYTYDRERIKYIKMRLD